jgi:membrane protease YdiL (CAAX protease family)
MKKERNAWIVSLVVFVIWIVIVMGGNLIQASGKESLNELVSNGIVIGLVVAPIFLLGIVAYLKWWHEVTMDTFGNFGKYIYLWLPALYILYHFFSAFRKGLPAGNVITFVLINTLLVGISEELMFRGVLFHGSWSKFGAVKTVWITGIIFGGVHSLNGFITGDFAAATGQALGVLTMGVMFGALRLQLGSLYPLMIVHWLWDFSVFLGSSGPSQAALDQFSPTLIMLTEIAIPFVINIPLLLYGIWLLRKWKREQTETAQTDTVAV